MRRTAPVPLSPHAHRQHTSTAHKAYAWKVRWMAGGGGPTTGPPALFTPLLPQGGRGWASLPLLTPPAASTWPPSVLTMTPPPIIVHAHLPGFSYQGFPTRVFLPGLSYQSFPTRAFLPAGPAAYLPVWLSYLQDLLPTCLYGLPTYLYGDLSTCRTCACMHALPPTTLAPELRLQLRYPRQPPRPPALLSMSASACVYAILPPTCPPS